MNAGMFRELMRTFAHPAAAASTVSPAEMVRRDPYSPEAIRQRRGYDFLLVPTALALWIVVAATVITRTGWPVLIAVNSAFVLIAFLYMADYVVSRQGWFTTAHRNTGALGSRRVDQGRYAEDSEEPLRLVAVATRQIIVSTLCAAIAGTVTWMRLLQLSTTPVLRALTAGRGATLRGDYAVASSPQQLDGGGVLLDLRIPHYGQLPLFLKPHQTKLDILGVQPGQRLAVVANAQLSNRPSLVPVILQATGDITWADDPSPQGIWAITAWLRQGLRTAVEGLPMSSQSLIPGMTLGDTSAQTPEQQQWFTATGLSHLTAVSGSNVAIVVSAVMIVLSALGLARQWRFLGCAVALVGFVLLVGPEPSVLRAAVMGCVGLVAVATSRWRDVLASLCAAVISVLVLNPSMAVSYGFALSVFATVGVVAVAPRLSLALLRWWWHRCEEWWRRVPSVAESQLIRMVCVAFAADAVTSPVIVLMTGKVSLVAVVANSAVVACVPLVTVLGLCAAPVGGVLVLLGAPSWLAWPVVGAAVPAAWWIDTVAELLAGMPRLSAPAGWGSAVLWVLVWVVIIASLFSFRLWWMWRWVWLALLLVGSRVVTVEVEEGNQGTWSAPKEVSVGDRRLWEVANDEEALRLQGLDPRRDVVVVRECGDSFGRPTLTREGVAVFYPCRDGTRVM